MNPLNSTYIATATTTTIKTGRGNLARIVLTETAAGTIVVYDNTAASGTILASFKASVGEQTFEIGCKFQTGLTVITGAASKLSVIWE